HESVLESADFASFRKEEIHVVADALREHTTRKQLCRVRRLEVDVRSITPHRRRSGGEQVQANGKIDALEQTQPRVAGVDGVAGALTHGHFEAVLGELLTEWRQTRNGGVAELAGHSVPARKRWNGIHILRQSAGQDNRHETRKHYGRAHDCPPVGRSQGPAVSRLHWNSAHTGGNAKSIPSSVSTTATA